MNFTRGKNYLYVSGVILVFAFIQNLLSGIFMLFTNITMIFDIVYQNEAILYCLGGAFFLCIGLVEGYCSYLSFKNAKVTNKDIMTKCKFWAKICLICIVLDSLVSLFLLGEVYTTALMIAAPIILIKGANRNINSANMFIEKFNNPYEEKKEDSTSKQSENYENDKIE